ncbi:glycosyltransferase [Lagierella sp.]|uniref:glycosyltransferase n=1 Tax=Lagierella sp. TaxID=2849657 RepID=UPI0026061A6F|nr:glycosyltransferase [Lagierella sp.]
MKICYLADVTSAHTKKWCKYFLSKGYEIVIISLTSGEIPGCKVYDFNVGDTIYKSDINKLFSYFGKVKRVKELIKSENPDIIHAHYATSYGLLGSLLNFKPYILSVWGSDVYDFPRRSFIHRGLLKHNLKAPTLLMSTSTDMKKEIQKYTNRDVLVTYFGVDPDIYRPMEGLKMKDTFVMGTIKSLFKVYGLEYLVKAFKLLVDKYPKEKFKLILAGQGEEEDNLKKLVRDLNLENFVEFPGYLSIDDLVKTYNTMDIAVFPSLQESFGVSAVEAQSCGVPVVATDVGGLPEATNPSKSSLLVKPKDENELFKAMEKLYLDEDLRKTMGHNGRKYVLEKFVLEENFSHINKIYHSVLKGELNEIY